MRNKMLKVIIVGCPGSGKSTFAKKLSNIVNIPLYHLDMIKWSADKTTISKEEFDEKLKNILKKDKWIVDGNYQRTLEMRLKECDTMFLLDFSLEECILGAKSRIGTKRSDFPWIEENLDEEFKQVIIDFPKKKLPQIYELIEKYKMNKNIIIFKTREQVDNYLEMLKS